MMIKQKKRERRGEERGMIGKERMLGKYVGEEIVDFMI